MDCYSYSNPHRATRQPPFVIIPRGASDGRQLHAVLGGRTFQISTVILAREHRWLFRTKPPADPKEQLPLAEHIIPAVL